MNFDFSDIAQIFTFILTVDKWCVSNYSVTPTTVSSFYIYLFIINSESRQKRMHGDWLILTL